MIIYHIHLIQTWFLNVISAIRHLKKRELRRHVRSVHETQRHQCLVCKKLFTRKYTLTKHEKLHTRSNDRHCTKTHHEEGLHDQHDQVCIQ